MERAHRTIASHGGGEDPQDHRTAKGWRGPTGPSHLKVVERIHRIIALQRSGEDPQDHRTFRYRPVRTSQSGRDRHHGGERLEEPLDGGTVRSPIFVSERTSEFEGTGHEVCTANILRARYASVKTSRSEGLAAPADMPGRTSP